MYFFTVFLLRETPLCRNCAQKIEFCVRKQNCEKGVARPRLWLRQKNFFVQIWKLGMQKDIGQQHGGGPSLGHLQEHEGSSAAVKKSVARLRLLLLPGGNLQESCNSLVF